jgi:hypothetical protein
MRVEQRGTDQPGPAELRREIRRRGRVYELVVRLTDGGRADVSFESRDEDDRVLSDVRGVIVVDDIGPAARMIAKELAGLVALRGEARRPRPGRATRPDDRAYVVADLRQVHPNAHRPWSQVDDERLRARFREGASHETLAADFGRTPSAIATRLDRIGESVPPPVAAKVD